MRTSVDVVGRARGAKIVAAAQGLGWCGARRGYYIDIYI